MLKRVLLTAAAVVAAIVLYGQALDALPEVLEGAYRVRRDVPYVEGPSDAYRRERAVLDLYWPAARRAGGQPLVVWFHGGGLTGGAKHLPEGLRRRGFAVASVEYRLAPRAAVTEIIDDAAAAVAWALDSAAAFGTPPGGVFVTGHSAGGYLASMIAMDTLRLTRHGHHPSELGGVAPLSGHAVTHFTERAARGVPGERIVADSLAPIFHVRAGRTPPLLLITGDRELELLGRYEENAFFRRMVQVAGNDGVELHELGGYGHAVVEPALPIVAEWIRKSFDAAELPSE